MSCHYCGSGKGMDRTYARCTVCGEPYTAGSLGLHWRTQQPPPPEFFLQNTQLGRLSLLPDETWQEEHTARTPAGSLVVGIEHFGDVPYAESLLYDRVLPMVDEAVSEALAVGC